MNLPSSSSPPRPLFKYLSAVLTILSVLFCLYWAVLAWRSQPSSPPAGPAGPPADAAFSPKLTDRGGGWWETEASIYHGIPAKILFCRQTAQSPDPEVISRSAWREFERIGNIFNPFDPGSEIARLNGPALNQPQTITVSKDVFRVLVVSREIWEASGGAFDPAIWPIKQLWREAEKRQQVPSPSAIRSALDASGLGKVRLLDAQTHRIDMGQPKVSFDFGGVVKGYAVDQVRRVLVGHGVRAGLVQLGGEISAFGQGRDGPWRIGVQHPKALDRLWGVVSASGNLRVSTSGNYRQPIVIQGRSFYHIFSPKTGLPVSEEVLGVTVVCLDGGSTNARLDAIATAICVLGPAAGVAMGENLNIDVLVLVEEAEGGIRELRTRGLEGYYQRDRE